MKKEATTRKNDLAAFGRLLDIMDRLREECPWDREQTFESLRNNTIEETYELADAIADGNMDEICGELGDLLLHVVFYSKIGSERGAFDIAGVCDRICDKLVYRHPHVFGDNDADTPRKVMENWEDLKRKENVERKSVLQGVPRSLPAMVKAYRIGAKAASAGFDWKQPQDVWDKVREELAEVETEFRAGDRDHLEEEIGDLFFALINASRLYGIDPELALERSNKKFIKRFTYLENNAAEAGRTLREMTLEEMEEVWQMSKKEKL